MWSWLLQQPRDTFTGRAHWGVQMVGCWSEHLVEITDVPKAYPIPNVANRPYPQKSMKRKNMSAHHNTFTGPPPLSYMAPLKSCCQYNFMTFMKK